MEQLDLEKAGYKYFKSNPLREHSKCFYQKKCRDGEYFINCVVYEDNCYDSSNEKYENYYFEVEFNCNDIAINIQTVQWFNDPLEQYRPYPSIEEVENMIDKLYLCYTNL